MSARYYKRMILLDGKALAEKIKNKLKSEYQKLGRKITLVIVQVGSNFVSEKFVEQKKKLGEELGISVVTRRYKDIISGSALRKNIAELAHDKKIDGIVIQLPLPSTLNVQDILNAVPPGKDVDVLSARAVGDFATGKSNVLPPVVGAIDALFREYGIEYADKKIVVVGAGRLVGKPVSGWLSRQDIGYCLLTDTTSRSSHCIKDADILISGAGKPKLITGDMVKEGAVIIDAGTSIVQPESGSRKPEAVLAGDVDFDSVAPKSSYITPVPGGVGPLTVVMIFKNLLQLARRSRIS